MRSRWGVKQVQSKSWAPLQLLALWYHRSRDVSVPAHPSVYWQGQALVARSSVRAPSLTVRSCIAFPGFQAWRFRGISGRQSADSCWMTPFVPWLGCRALSRSSKAGPFPSRRGIGASHQIVRPWCNRSPTYRLLAHNQCSRGVAPEICTISSQRSRSSFHPQDEVLYSSVARALRTQNHKFSNCYQTFIKKGQSYFRLLTGLLANFQVWCLDESRWICGKTWHLWPFGRRSIANVSDLSQLCSLLAPPTDFSLCTRRRGRGGPF